MKSNTKAKQKASELIIKSPYATANFMGKICALMIVDEILNVYNNFDMSIIKKKHRPKLTKECEFWKEVERELRKVKQ